MTGLVRKATLLAVCGLVVASVAMAGIPDPTKSTKPLFIDVVGTSSGTPDSRGTFTIIVRDGGNNPIQNSQVVIDLGACTDMKLCSQVIAGLTTDCPTKTVRAFTDALGSVTFTILGGGRNTGAVAGPGAGCVNILASGVSLVHATATELDENGAVSINGVEVTDLNSFLKDLGAGIYFGRSDFNHGGTVEVTDLTTFLSVLGSGTSANGCFTTYCP